MNLNTTDQLVTTLAMAKRIELWPLDRLVPYSKNARTHSDEQVMQIAASIAQFGFVNPVLVDSDDGILAGHGPDRTATGLGEGGYRCVDVGDQCCGWPCVPASESCRPNKHSKAG